MSILKYRVNFMPAIEVSSESIRLGFKTKEEADQNLSSIATTLLFLHTNLMMCDFSSLAWVEEFVDGEWEEVEDE